MAGAKIVGTTLVLHRKENLLYYGDHTVSYFNVHGRSVGFKEYTLFYVDDYRPETAEIKLLQDPQKIDHKAYALWLSHHEKVWRDIVIKYIFLTN